MRLDIQHSFLNPCKKPLHVIYSHVHSCWILKWVCWWGLYLGGAPIEVNHFTCTCWSTISSSLGLQKWHVNFMCRHLHHESNLQSHLIFVITTLRITKVSTRVWERPSWSLELMGLPLNLKNQWSSLFSTPYPCTYITGASQGIRGKGQSQKSSLMCFRL